MTEDQIECMPIAELYELTVTVADGLTSPMAAYNARRAYLPLEFKRVEGSECWIARAHLAPKQFAERIAGRLALVDGVITRLKRMEVSK